MRCDPRPVTLERVDPGKLRDPKGFVDAVAGFINSVDGDIRTLQHFADTYARSQKTGRDDRNAMALLSKDIGALGDAAEAPLARLGRDMKNATAKQHEPAPAPRDTRSPERKKSDSSAWARVKKSWFPRG
jgi:hypothetical protein